MRPVEQELSDSYRNLSETDIASLHADAGSLSDTARVALTKEIQRRGMSDAHLLKLYSAELRHEANFDRTQQIHRKRVAAFLSRNLIRDPKWTMAAILAFIVMALLYEQFSHHR
jgi:hypothetical protein